MIHTYREEYSTSGYSAPVRCIIDMYITYVHVYINIYERRVLFAQCLWKGYVIICTYTHWTLRIENVVCFKRMLFLLGTMLPSRRTFKNGCINFLTQLKFWKLGWLYKIFGYTWRLCLLEVTLLSNCQK